MDRRRRCGSDRFGCALERLCGGKPVWALPAQDKRILTYLLSLERLEVAWHTAAADIELGSELAGYAQTVAQHDSAHVSLLENLVGDRRGKSALPDVSDALPSAGRFGSDAVSIKEAVVAAYIGQSGNLTPGAVLDIARITAVEARHASWLLDIVGRLPAPSSADTASSQRQVTAVLRRLGLAKGG
ncbi:MAG: ferritin-like domain-containing protein [Actinobacteria bacterium]|nr:ferritin-like domain-containing protein [Actinomycetota bacterium]